MTPKPVRKAILAAIAVAVSLPLQAAPAKRAVTIEDLHRVKGVGDAAISPDGRTVAYARTSGAWTPTGRTPAP
jgi:hypothetical protein